MSEMMVFYMVLLALRNSDHSLALQGCGVLPKCWNRHHGIWRVCDRWAICVLQNASGPKFINVTDIAKLPLCLFVRKPCDLCSWKPRKKTLTWGTAGTVVVLSSVCTIWQDRALTSSTTGEFVTHISVLNCWSIMTDLRRYSLFNTLNTQIFVFLRTVSLHFFSWGRELRFVSGSIRNVMWWDYSAVILSQITPVTLKPRASFISLNLVFRLFLMVWSVSPLHIVHKTHA